MTKEFPILLSAKNPIEHMVGGHTFIIGVPTQLMKEKLGLRLYELGVVQVPPATMRAVTVNELFELMDEDKAEEAADLLHEFWTADDEHILAVDRWRQRNIQRVLDFANGAPQRDPEPEPEHPVAVRTRYKVQGIMDFVNENSRRYRDAQSRRLDFQNANARMMLRIAIVGCVGHTVDLKVNEDDILTDDSLENIRGAVGAEGVKNLIDFINSQYGLSGDEKQNFPLPGENTSDEIGSTDENDVSGSSDGSSDQKTLKTSNTGQAPSAGSGKTTAKSSVTSSGTSRERTRRRGRTGAAGSSSR